MEGEHTTLPGERSGEAEHPLRNVILTVSFAGQ
jgi:hypothetical protein